jgi:NADH-quinone oxidoreductase subunit N
MISANDLIAILPLIIVTAGATVAMVSIAIRRSHALIAGISMLSLIAAFVSLWPAAALTPRDVTPLLRVDAFALFFTGLVLAGSILTTLLSYGYLETQRVRREEFYILLLIAVSGAVVLSGSDHFISFFVGLELLSIPLYGLLAYVTLHQKPLEAGIKYLLLAGASSAFLLFGMALIYVEGGTMEFGAFPVAGPGLPGANISLVFPGIVLMLAGIGFKLGVVPFHLWTPDVYEGAPAPVTAFVASVSKTAAVAVTLRLFTTSIGFAHPGIGIILTIVAITSMFAGNLLALLQPNVKRILAYSSIAHLGYALAAIVMGTGMAQSATAFYMAAYTATTIAAFGVVSVLTTRTGGEPVDIADYVGLFWKRPWIAGVFTAALLSLIGMPLTAGFIGKYYVVAAGASVGAWALIISLVAASAIGAYYYLRIIVAMYQPTDSVGAVPPVSFPGGLALAVSAAAVLFLGILPSPLMELLRGTVLTAFR